MPIRIKIASFILSILCAALVNAAEKIDLNTATAEELDTLPGVGKYTAEKIISMRPITDLDALLVIKGMKPSEVDALRGLVTFGSEPFTTQNQKAKPGPETAGAGATPMPALSEALTADIKKADQYLKDRKSPPPDDWQRVIAKWESDADSGSPKRAAPARWKLGQCYLEGIGVEKDTAKGIQYSESAAQADPESWRFFNVAKLFRRGGSVPSNPEKEIYWTEKAANAGSNVWAEYRLAQLYGFREDKAPNYAAALEWARRAQQNNPPAEIVKPLNEYVETFTKLLRFPKPGTFQISVAGSPVNVTRIGTGPVGVIFFPHTGARAMKQYLLTNQDRLQDLITKQCSLFLWVYPETAPFDQTQPILHAYMQGDRSVRLPLSGIASSIVTQIKENSGLKDFLLVGNSLGAGMILQDYPDLVRDKALSFLLVSPTEPAMPELQSLPAIERTTIIAAQNEVDPDTKQVSDIWLRGNDARTWVGKNRTTKWDAALSEHGLESGHFIFGEKFTANLIALFISKTLGFKDNITVPASSAQTDRERPVATPINEVAARSASNLSQTAGVPARPELPRTLPLARPQHEGKVVAWGFVEGSYGGNEEARQLITPPDGLMAVQVSASRNGYSQHNIHCLALKADGTVAAWGWNGEGQCDVPAGLSNVVFVAAGNGVSLAIKADGTVTAWGSGKRFVSLPPNLSNVVQAAFTNSGTLFLFSDGTCRYVPESKPNVHRGMEKREINGQIYEYPGGLRSSADVDASIVAAKATNLVAIAGGRYGYGLTSGGKVIVFHLRNDPAGVIPEDLGPVATIPSTDESCSHVGAVQIDGTVRAWGRNDTGQCDVPANMPPIKSLSTSHDHTTAITIDGKLIIWGTNWSGERDIPQDLSNSKFVQVAAGQGFNIAIIQ